MYKIASWMPLALFVSIILCIILSQYYNYYRYLCISLNRGEEVTGIAQSPSVILMSDVVYYREVYTCKI